jgi:hypothetical protein
VSGGVISEDVLIQIAELNYDFLRVLRVGPIEERTADRLLGLRRNVLERLLALADEHLRRLAACPYALFDLRLGDVQFWRAVRGRHVPTTYATADMPDFLRQNASQFVAVALMYAWHLARTQPIAAMLTMGMTQETANTFALKSIVTFRAVTNLAPGLLIAAQGDNKVLWPDLVHYVVSGTRAQFEAAVRRGSQLIAGSG